jgi:type IV pilus assembly protein PilW
MKPSTRSSGRKQLIGFRRDRALGLTLLELLVAMVIGLVVVLAAVTALTVSRRGFTTVDAASQLRDSGRFASDLIQRIGVQTGYRDVVFAALQRKTAADPPPNVSGFNNALLSASDPLNSFVARSNASVVGYGSDILILRYQASQLYTMTENATQKTVSDQTMIDCAGNPAATVTDIDNAAARDERMASIFHIAVNQNEPALMCTYPDPATAGAFKTVPVVQGVEQLQVLYGVDGVTPGAAPPAGAATPSLPTRYLRADEMVVAGNAAGTRANWRRVRSIRVGLILRSAPGSTQTNESTTYYPFGAARSSATSTDKGSAFKSTSDTGTTFTAPADGRLRQVVTFTIHIRNDQGL